MARDGERGRGDWKARPGSQNSGPYAEATGDTGPVDIAAVRRDDALIDAISGDGPVQTDTSEEYQLAALLANWRADILAEPMPAGPDLDSIVAAVNQEIGARQARIGARTGGRLRLVRPILGSAAALALVFGGLTAFSYNASPGDPLWRVKEVVFSEQAQSTVVSRADDDLQQAQQLIASGKPEEAKALLERASDNAGQVNDSTKKDDLVGRWQQLYAQLQQVAPDVAKSLESIAPTPSVKVPATSAPNVPVTPANPTNGTEPSSVGGPSTTYDPRGLETTPGANPGGGGGVSTLPATPPANTVPAQPPSDASEAPVTAPTGGAGAPTTPVQVPPPANGTGTSIGVTEPTPHQPIETAPPAMPSSLNLPTGGAVAPPPAPAHSGTH